jgi:hypothetical protein
VQSGIWVPTFREEPAAYIFRTEVNSVVRGMRQQALPKRCYPYEAGQCPVSGTNGHCSVDYTHKRAQWLARRIQTTVLHFTLRAQISIQIFSEEF